jgi:hypothetical protein
MTTNQDLLMNGLNQIIANLISGPSPSLPPGDHAWPWFRSSSGPQNAAVNSYVSVGVTSQTATTLGFRPTKNWALWSTLMQADFTTATGSVAAWLSTPYTGGAVPTVPDDVVTWTKGSLPLVAINEDLLINGLSGIIYDLVTANQRPTNEPDRTAYDWLTSQTPSNQPSQVNDYLKGKLIATSTRELYSVVNNNASLWMAGMSTSFKSAPGGSVLDWLLLSAPYAKLTQDLPIVPDDVITWTKANMPVYVNMGKGAREVEVKPGTPSPVGG